jgi:hypothetical protein
VAVYEVIWSSKWDQGTKIVGSAIMALTWIAEFRGKGADAVKVTRDGVLVEEDELEALIKPETEAHRSVL